MGFKEFEIKLIENNRFLRKCKFMMSNKTSLGNNNLEADNIHFSNNRILMKGERQELKCASTSFLRDCIITIDGSKNIITIDDESEVYGSSGSSFYVEGNNNKIIIGKNCKIRNSSFMIHGNNNQIFIGDNISCFGAEFDLRQDNNQIIVGKNSSFHGRDGYPVHIVADEGKNVLIGEDCMFSKDIQIRTSDSHSIVDLTGMRLNPAEDVVIGEHVWISLGVTLLKGSNIPGHSVVAADAVCTKAYQEEHCIIAGNPAKIIKHDIDWDRKFV